MTDPSDSSDPWFDRFLDVLFNKPVAEWPGLVLQTAPDARDRLVEALQTIGGRAADITHGLAGTEADRAAVAGVLDELAIEYPEHAAELRGYGPLYAALAAPVVDRRLAAGDRLGPFTVERVVGEGGMGVVYAARQDGLDRIVALKVVRRSASPLHRARFDRERLVLAKLHHSKIVPVYHAGEQDGRQYYAMQYVPGVTLGKVLAAVQQRDTVADPTPVPPLAAFAETLTRTPAAPTDAIPKSDRPANRVPVRLSAGYFRSVAKAMEEVAEAIHHGHELDIIHRDIKPANLVVDADGGCRVIDYGLAHAPGADAAPTVGGVLEDAVTHGWAGTPQYMAPEQFDGHADKRSDVWSLGATLYHLLALRQAFAGKTLSAVREKVRVATPEPVRNSVANAPRDLEAICRKALAKEPAGRYGSAKELANDLRRWLDGKPSAARPGWATLRPLRLWAWRHKGAAAAVVLVLAGIVAVSVGSAAFARVRAQLAEAEAGQQREQREAADVLAGQRQKELDFVRVLGEAEELRRRRPAAGWSDEVRKKLDVARRIRPDALLRDAYAATLTGPDARRVREYLHPEGRGPVKAGFGSVAFGPGDRLVCGGFLTTPGMVFDPNLAQPPVPTTRAEIGLFLAPVAFPVADRPLQLCPPAPGEREFVLWNLATNTAVAGLPLPPAATAVAAALSANGRRAAVAFVRAVDKDGKQAGQTIVWEVGPKADAPAKLQEWPTAATALAFSPDGKYLASGTPDGGVTVRDAATGAAVATVSAGRLRIQSLAFGRNYRADVTGRPPAAGAAPEWLLAAGAGSSVTVWDLGTRQPVSRCRGASQFVNALAFFPDGSTLVTAGHSAPIVWDVPTGNPLFDLRVVSAGEGGDTHLTGVAVSADGRRVAVTGTNLNHMPARMQVYEFDADRGVGVYRGLSGVCQQTWMSPSGELVAGLSDEWQLAVWDRKTGRVRRAWDVPAGITADNAAVAFDEQAGAVYFSSGDAAHRLNLATGGRDQTWKLGRGLNDTFHVRPGRLPVLARREGRAPNDIIRCRELLPDGTTRDKFPGFPPGYGDIGWMYLVGGGKYLLVTRAGRKPENINRLYDAETGRAVVLPPPPAGVTLLDLIRVSEDGTRLFAHARTGAAPPTLAQFRLADMTLVRADHGFPADVTDDTGAVGVWHVVGERGGIYVFRAGQSEPVAVFDAGHMPRTLGITPDGRFVHAGREDGSVRVVDLTRALERLTTLTGR